EFYDKIIVLGSGVNSKLVSEVGTGTNVGVFQVPDATSQKELDSLASSLYSLYSTPKQRIRITTSIWEDLEPGDLISYNSNIYMVYDITHTLDKTELTAGYYSEDLGHLIKKLSRIQHASGTVTSGVVVTEEIPLPYRRIGSLTTRLGQVNVTDTILSAKLRLHLTDWRRDQYQGGENSGVTIDVDTITSVNDPRHEHDADTDASVSDPGHDHGSSVSIYEAGPVSSVIDFDEYSALDSPTSVYISHDAYGVTDGMQIAIGVAHINIQNTNASETVYSATLRWENPSTSDYELKDFGTITLESNEEHDFVLVAVVSGRSTPTVQWRIDLEGSSTSVYLALHTYFIDYHSHSNSSDVFSGDTGITVSPSTNVYLNSTGITVDTDAYPSVYDPVHTHPSSTAITDLNYYPSNVNVKVGGTTVATLSGGSDEVHEIDITDILSSPGTYDIEVTSDTAGGIEGTLIIEKFVRR
ncbi:MAG: hypothetical protein ACTSPB_03590, partial [Candidatus Thorarchaeota archaeon]